MESLFTGGFTLGFGVLVWMVVLGAVLLLQRGRTPLGAGLVLGYFMNLALIHLPGAILYVNPDYQLYDRSWVVLGFEQSTWGAAAFGVGAMVTFWLLRVTRRLEPLTQEIQAQVPLYNPWLYRFYVVLGLVSYFVITPLAQEVATLGAVVSVLNQLLLLGICLGMWHAWRRRNWLSLVFWIGTLGLLPVITIIFQGFIGFGVTALMVGLAFLASFFRPRWVVLVAGTLFVFVGLSSFVTYFRDRSEIRQVVWGGESIEERFVQLADTYSTMEWFNINDRRHANYLDERLNQNWLVGAAVKQIINGKNDFKYGATISDAVIALVPRAIWADKPVRAGSGSLASDATGIPFATGTSVGVGQILEFYINFGTPSVIIGMFLWGVALAVLDVMAARRLQQGQIRIFTLVYLVGLGLIQPGGSLVEVFATSAAALLAALAVNDFLVPFFVGVFEEPEVPTMMPSSGAQKKPPPPPAPKEHSLHV